MPQAPAAGAHRDGRELSGPLARRELVCPTCGYRIVRDRHPDHCPMCGGERWDFASWQLFGRPVHAKRMAFL